MGIPWDGMGLAWTAMEWNGTEKYVPWTSLGIMDAQKALIKSPRLRKFLFVTVKNYLQIRKCYLTAVKKCFEMGGNFAHLTRTNRVRPIAR